MPDVQINTQMLWKYTKIRGIGIHGYIIFFSVRQQIPAQGCAGNFKRVAKSVHFVTFYTTIFKQ